MPGGSPITVRLQDLTVDVSLSGVARGDLLYRGASKWQNLAAGTSGYFLKSNGAGADPSWASVSLSPAGENRQLQYNAEGSFAGAQNLLYQPRGSVFTVRSGGRADVPLTLDCPSGQTGNLLNLLVNSLSVGSISSAGVLQLGGTLVNDGLTISGAYPCTITARVSNGSYSVGDGTLRSGSGNALTLRGSLASGAAVLIENIGSSGFGDTCRITAGAATSQVLQLRGTTSQTGSLLNFQGTSTSTGGAAGTAQAEVDTAWNDSTHATRSADLIFRAYYTSTAREGLRIRGGSSDVQLGFYGVTPISRAVLATGAGATVDNVITALQNLGLVKQS